MEKIQCNLLLPLDDINNLVKESKEYKTKIMQLVEMSKLDYKLLVEDAKKLAYEDAFTKNIKHIDEEKNKKYFEGYVQGLLDGNGFCPRCKKTKASSFHHIQPRKYFGEDSPENIIVLCKKCHDIVEEYTGELYHKDNTFHTIEKLKKHILFGFPQEG